MDDANNPVEGTGSVQTENQALSFTELLDSENGTTENVISKDEETEEVSDALDETENTESDEDADHVEDEEGDEDSEDATDEEAETAETFNIPDDATVTLADGSTVSGKELMAGYQRQADYTRKTQELAVERKAYVDNRVDLTALHHDYANSINRLQDVMMIAGDFKEPDWDFLRANDPHEFLIKQGEWEKKSQLLSQLDQERARIAAHEAETARITRLQAQHNAYNALQEHIPEFKEPEKAKANLARIESFLTKDCHFKQSEVDNISDPRLFVLALDALQWREHSAKVPEVVKRMEKKPALIQPGTVAKKSTRSTFDEKMREAHRTGDNRNLFLHLLDNE